MLESAIRELFDYQRFEPNASLQSVIDEVLDKYAQNRPVAIPDEELAMAAGGVELPTKDATEPENDERGMV